MNLVILLEEELAGNGMAVIRDPRRVTHIQDILRATPEIPWAFDPFLPANY